MLLIGDLRERWDDVIAKPVCLMRAELYPGSDLYWFRRVCGREGSGPIIYQYQVDEYGELPTCPECLALMTGVVN